MFFCYLQNFIKSDWWTLQANLRGKVESIKLQIPNSFTLTASPQSMEGSFWTFRQATNILIYNLTLLKICILIYNLTLLKICFCWYSLRARPPDKDLHLVWYIHLPNTVIVNSSCFLAKSNKHLDLLHTVG